MRHLISIIILATLAASIVWGSTSDGNALSNDQLWPHAELGNPGAGTQALVRTVVALAIVLGLILAMAYLINHLGPRFRKVQGRQLRLVETMPLGARRALHVVEFANRRYLIGSTTSQITLLASEGSDPVHPVQT
ncbi:MAG: flagellar biosynthetic protein FliO [Sedimentisphaerales bacterium]|jgi:flagellar biosynthetic protein FliO|nr:flagellar biosynthetic protein FliO [Sedimentisphaerales bacterium]